jgi:hypothetical protein
MAFFLAALLVLVAVLIDLIQLRQAQLAIDGAVVAAAVDGARLDLGRATLIPRCPSHEPCTPPPRVLAIPSDGLTLVRARRSLAANLASVAYLLDGATAEEIAAKAEIAVVNPAPGRCQPSPFAGEPEVSCYYDAFVAVRAKVPLHALWGATTVVYPATAVGALTDDPLAQRPATPIPTSSPAPAVTFVPPRPTISCPAGGCP